MTNQPGAGLSLDRSLISDGVDIDPVAGSGVVVVGMHRSGTSAITRVVNLLGVALGRSDDLYSAPDNPAGHWESVALCATNDGILQAFGGLDVTPPLFRPLWEYSLRALDLIPALERVFRYVYEGRQQWLWKDPRLSLTLPIWRIILRRIVVVLVIRNADAVVDSLHRRTGYPPWYCRILWEHYNRSAVAALAGLPVFVADFDRIMLDPEPSVMAIRDSLAQLGVRLEGDVAAAAASLRSDVLHRSAAPPAEEGLLQNELKRLAGFHAEFRPPDFPKESEWIRPAFAVGMSWVWLKRGHVLRGLRQAVKPDRWKGHPFLDLHG